MSIDLVTVAEATALVEKFAHALKHLDQALGLLTQAENCMLEAAAGHPQPGVVDWLCQEISRNCRQEFDHVALMDSARLKLGRRAWMSLLHTSRLRSVLDTSSLQLYIDQARADDVPFTVTEILRVYRGYAEELDEIRSRSILSVLQRLSEHPCLRRRRFPLQTELPLGKLFSTRAGDRRYEGYESRTLIDDIEVLLYALERQWLPAPQDRAEPRLLAAFQESDASGTRCETPYFNAQIDCGSGEVYLFIRQEALIARAKLLWHQAATA